MTLFFLCFREKRFLLYLFHIMLFSLHPKIKTYKRKKIYVCNVETFQGYSKIIQNQKKEKNQESKFKTRNGHSSIVHLDKSQKSFSKKRVFSHCRLIASGNFLTTSKNTEHTFLDIQNLKWTYANQC